VTKVGNGKRPARFRIAATLPETRPTSYGFAGFTARQLDLWHVLARDIDCVDDNDLSHLPVIPYDPATEDGPLRRPPAVWEAIASSNAALSFAGTKTF
jgi:hypothetical protein